MTKIQGRSVAECELENDNIIVSELIILNLNLL